MAGVGIAGMCLAGPHDKPPPQSSPKAVRMDAAQARLGVEADWLAQAKRPPDARHFTMGDMVGGGDYPTARFIRQGYALADDLARSGADVARYRAELKELERLLSEIPEGAAAEARERVYLDVRRVVRRLAFANPLLDFDRLLFVKRFTQETYPDICLNHMPWVSRPGGDLCVLENPFSPSGEGQSLTSILNGALGPGHVHGMDLEWDGERIVFGYARTKTAEPPEGWMDRAANFHLRRTEEPTRLFEVRRDGSGLRQLTSGEWSDLDPTYAPNGDIVFVSERCAFSLQCNEYDKDETSCNLYTMRPDGSGIRRLSVNKDGDYLPHTLDDGTIGYTRWEYHERSFAYIQSLWFVRPDGTGADVIFGQHLQDPWALEDVRSIPGSRKLVAVAAGHHTLAIGPLLIIDPTQGLNDAKGIAIVTPNIKPTEGGMSGAPVPEGGVTDTCGLYSTPWALSEKYFLVAYTYSNTETDAKGYALYLVDVFGNKELIYRDPAISSFIPIPLRPRPRPPLITGSFDEHAAEPPEDGAPPRPATCVISDIALGCDGIDPAAIRYVRIAEPIGWPYDNTHGGHRYVEDHHCQQPSGEPDLRDNWTPVRILGDIPVEADGSACFQVPPDTAVYFQLLDENRREIRRMRSFISFQPSEQRACAGCHETRNAAPRPNPAPPAAAARTPAPYLPMPWGDAPLSFLRDVQPVLTRHCAQCHSGLKPKGGLDFSPGLTSFDTAVPGYGYNRAFVTLLDAKNGLITRSPAREQDASVTPPYAYGANKSKLGRVLDAEPHTKRVKLTPDERLRLDAWIDANAIYHDRFVNKRAPQPAYDYTADPELRGKILAIHERRCAACHDPKAVTRTDWIHPSDPAQSLFLTAPRTKCEGTPYASADDPDHQALLELTRQAVEKASRFPRRDLAGARF
ncbi:MAG: hypothetical protein FWG50_06105 [Kiritimatiellaeota bacterium]|nr:hypothetical protein [Kiritimatiellota bacterium]